MRQPIRFLALGLLWLACGGYPCLAQQPTKAEPKPIELPSLTNSIGIKLLKIPPGEFMMGSPSTEKNRESKEAQVKVTLSKDFWLGQTEVTNAQWKLVMGSVPSDWKDDDRPVVKVSWENAMEFCRKLSALPEEQKAGRVYRLPTEAEWEYACRAGTKTAYSFGDDESLLGDYGWFDKNSDGQTHPVGKKHSNAWGLHDMHGNVWEWCSDRQGDYPNGAVTDPQGPPTGSLRVLRGGSWLYPAGFCRSAHRYCSYPSNRRYYLGFRLALSPSGAESPEAASAVRDAAKAEPKPIELPSHTNSIGIKLLRIPRGEFMMGSPSTEKNRGANETQVKVTLSKDFWLGQTEVTNAQWKLVMGSVPSDWKDDDRPVVKVSWENAMEFCRKLSALPEEQKADRVYRLPTEAEWEYACRAGTKTAYSFGDDESLLRDYGWFHGHSDSQTHPVGQKKPNAWGLYDMHGNVLEWCSDWYGGYPAGALTDPHGPPTGSDRVFRGGSWYYAAWRCRSADRLWRNPSYRLNFLGFRLALSPSGAESPEAGK